MGKKGYEAMKKREVYRQEKEISECQLVHWSFKGL